MKVKTEMAVGLADHTWYETNFETDVTNPIPINPIGSEEVKRQTEEKMVDALEALEENRGNVVFVTMLQWEMQ